MGTKILIAPEILRHRHTLDDLPAAQSVDCPTESRAGKFLVQKTPD